MLPILFLHYTTLLFTSNTPLPLLTLTAWALSIVNTGLLILTLVLASPSELNWWHLFNTSLTPDIPSSNGSTVTSPQVNAVMYLALTGVIQLQLFATRNPSFWWHFSRKTAPPPALMLVVPAVCLLCGEWVCWVGLQRFEMWSMSLLYIVLSTRDIHKPTTPLPVALFGGIYLYFCLLAPQCAA